jgi:predicted dehydrogenase
VDPQLSQAWPEPGTPLPIVVVGAGGIINDAHLPAYQKAGFDVVGITDINLQKAEATARKWRIGKVYASVDDATEYGTDCIYDLATPPAAIPEILARLPEGAGVLIQKPMGEDLAQAQNIHDLCVTRRLDAAVNFQLRFSPMMLAARQAIRSGLLGELLDIEVHVNILTPWGLFPFLKDMERVEIAVHSIHYLDLVRSLAGEPLGVFARSIGDPRVPELAQTRTSVILDYGESLRALMSINHNHGFGRDFQAASIRFEGSRGCIVAKLGLLLNYPEGEPDELWFCASGGTWLQIDLAGRWFPDAFANIMRNMQRFRAGEDTELITSVADSLKTMELVESCFVASRTSSTTIHSPERQG